MKNLEFSHDLKLPADAVTQTLAFLARKGAGKTYGASKLAEEMLGVGAQVVVIDPVGVWYGLRIAADGKGKGFEIPVFGGLHGDIPLEPGAGALVADLVVDRGISVVLDVSMFRKGERKRFVTEFAEQLFHRKKSARTPLHLFIEEAQVFVPQRVLADEARMLGAFEDLVKLGRNFGIGVTLISQRPQAVNKDALNQTECLVVLQTNGAQERKALKEWIVDQGLDVGELIDALPSLHRGEAYVWSPSWLRITKRVKIAAKRTFNASATPELGAKHPVARELAPVDLEEIRGAMRAVIDRAAEEDPKALRKQVQQLQAELAKAKTTTPAPAKPIEVPVIPEALVAELDKAAAEFTHASQFLHKTLLEVGRAVGAARDGQTEIARRLAPSRQIVAPARAPAPSTRERNALPGADGLATGYAIALLETMAKRHPMRLTRAQVSALSGRSPRSSTFDGALAEIKRKDLAREDGGHYQLTDAGMALVGHLVGTDAADPIESWQKALPAYERSLFDVLIEAHPRGLTRPELAERAGKSISSSAFDGAISTLKKNGLAESSSGEVRASDNLFLARGAA